MANMKKLMPIAAAASAFNLDHSTLYRRITVRGTSGVLGQCPALCQYR